MFKLFFTTTIAIFFCCFAMAQTTYFVDAARPDNSGDGTSWATAKKDLQAAINISFVGVQIWVKAGTYLPTHDPFANTAPTDNRDKTFTLKNGVKIYGGFGGSETQLNQRNWQTNITTLSGDLGVLNSVTDNAYHVVIAVAIGGADLDGFTITKGYAVSTQTSITVSSRVIERYKGGGIYNTGSAANFYNCIIKGNSADCTDGNDDAWGAGILNNNCSSIFNNCIIDGNSFLIGGSSFGVFGSGMYMIATSGVCTITECVFVNNTSGSGFIDGSKGGALYLNAGSNTITNCIFYNNTSQNGAAIYSGGAAANTSSITNCTFANNTSSFAGTTFSGFAKAVFKNCIFWNNAPTSSSVAGRDEIYSQETNVANQPTFSNCIVRDGVGNPSSVVNTIMSNSTNNNPLFVSLADVDGADNIYMTADDGLRLQCSSPAISTGTGATPVLDILGITRTSPFDIGAYEGNHVNSAFNTIPTAFTSVTISQVASGVSNYSNCTNQVAAIQSGGSYTLSGQTTASVWIEAIQPSAPGGIFVKRHYEINPVINTATASAKVTLFFTQQEFNDFNAVSVVDLPTGPADASGKTNLLIEKRAGVSSNGTGLPATYTGTAININPADADIVWNSTANRWEVGFDVAGFSGFFVKTQLAVLPLRLLSFSATAISGYNKLLWQTANEVNTKEFEIEKSSDGISFHTIGLKATAAGGNNQYQYNDFSITSDKTFYRLRMIDNDGRFSYSSVVTIYNKSNISVSMYPNPAHNVVVISSADISLLNSVVKVTDAGGRLLIQAVINGLPHSLNIETLSTGLYQLNFNNGTTLKLMKIK
jgi:Secretion system C-terminal sorting domain